MYFFNRAALQNYKKINHNSNNEAVVYYNVYINNTSLIGWNISVQWGTMAEKQYTLSQGFGRGGGVEIESCANPA